MGLQSSIVELISINIIINYSINIIINYSVNIIIILLGLLCICLHKNSNRNLFSVMGSLEIALLLYIEIVKNIDRMQESSFSLPDDVNNLVTRHK